MNGVEIIFETERLHFRKFTAADTLLIYEMISDPETMKYYPKVYTYPEAEEWLERLLIRYKNDGFGFWAPHLKKTNESIGQIGLLMQTVDEVNEVEIGYILNRKFWHQGFATEAAQGCKKYAFEKLNVNRVISIIAPENIPSINVALRNGMTLEKKSFWKEKEMNIYSVSRD